jgi:cell division protein FtsI (penicillin-binding protein 3)
MVENNKNIILRIYVVAVVIFFMALAIVLKITNIQWVEGDSLRKLANKHSIQNFVIPANKGNIYSADGSLLATSIPNYNIRFDALAPNDKDFHKNIKPLSDSLAVLFNKPSNYFHSELTRARTSGNRFYLLAKDLSYTQYMKIKKFPLFKLGIYRGGIIVDQQVVRKHPIGQIASRTIGYERITPEGLPDGKGIEWAFRKYLNGKDGKVLQQF